MVLVTLKDEPLSSHCGPSLAPLKAAQQAQLAWLCLAWSLPPWKESTVLLIIDS